MAGAVYGYIFKRYYNGDDTWGLNHDSWIQYQRLLHTPLLFLKDIFSANPVPSSPEFYFQRISYLETLEYCIVTKTFALFNFISQGNYYINIVFFNFLSFWGIYFLYKFIANEMNDSKRFMTAAVLFLFPPAMFWLSGLRAEGLLILFTGALLYQFSKWLSGKRLKNGLCSIVCFLMIFILRDGFALVLIPALLCWWITASFNTGARKTFAAVYIILILLVAAGSFLLPEKYNAFAMISARQQAFLELDGKTRFNLTALSNQPLSFIRVLPEALLNTFVRPFPWEAKGLLQWFASVENISVIAFMIITAFRCRGRYHELSTNPAIVMLALAALSGYLIIGYIVPFPGAIVRYKIIPELLLVSALLMCISRSFPAHKDHAITALGQI